jgi:hypothetical protein
MKILRQCDCHYFFDSNDSWISIALTFPAGYSGKDAATVFRISSDSARRTAGLGRQLLLGASWAQKLKRWSEVVQHGGIKPKVSAFPWWLMPVIALFNETLMELLEIR